MIYYLLLLLFFNRNLLYFIDLRYVNDLLYMNDLLYINDSKNTSNNNNNYLFDDNVNKNYTMGIHFINDRQMDNWNFEM
jgi:hypothetical protein